MLQDSQRRHERYPCPCCGYLTLREPPGSYDIRGVCYWEDDGVQREDPAYRGGANRVSLNEARENFARFGVSEERFKRYVRPPSLDELPDSTDG